jgi:hypothetical protein
MFETVGVKLRYRRIEPAFTKATTGMAFPKADGLAETAVRHGISERFLHAATPALADVGDRIVSAAVELAHACAESGPLDAMALLGTTSVSAASLLDSALNEAGVWIGYRTNFRLGRSARARHCQCGGESQRGQHGQRDDARREGAGPLRGGGGIDGHGRFLLGDERVVDLTYLGQ